MRDVLSFGQLGGFTSIKARDCGCQVLYLAQLKISEANRTSSGIRSIDGDMGVHVVPHLAVVFDPPFVGVKVGDQNLVPLPLNLLPGFFFRQAR